MDSGIIFVVWGLDVSPSWSLHYNALVWHTCVLCRITCISWNIRGEITCACLQYDDSSGTRNKVLEGSLDGRQTCWRHVTDLCACLQLDDSSGTRSKVLEGSLDGRQMRGFTQHQVPKQQTGQLRSVAPDGVVVNVGATLKDAIGWSRVIWRVSSSYLCFLCCFAKVQQLNLFWK